MATVIQIKRSSGSAAPSTSALVEGELAYSEDRSNSGAGAVLYIESIGSDGTTQVIDKIGGKYYTNTVDELLTPAAAGTAGALELFEATANGSNKILLTAPATLAANVTYTLPATPTNSYFLQTNATGTLSWQQVTSNFDIDGDTGLDTFNTGETLVFAGTANQMSTAVTNNTVTFALTNDVTLVGDLTVGGNDIKASDGATALTLTAASGNVTVAGDLKVGGNDILASDGVTALTLLASSGDVTVAGDLKVTGNDIKSSSGSTAITLSGTNVTVAGDLTVGGNDILASDGATALTLTASSGDVTVAGDLKIMGNDIKSSSGSTAITLSGTSVTVAGDLTVNGSTTVINSTTVTIDDSLLKLADGNIANSIDTGVYAEYVDTVAKYAGFFRDASDNNIFKFFKGAETEPTTTVNTAGTGYTVGTILANLTGGTVSSLASAIGVTDGGTGAATFTSNGVLYGNGTGAIQATAAGTDTYILKSNAGVPVWSNVIDGGTY